MLEQSILTGLARGGYYLIFEKDMGSTRPSLRGTHTVEAQFPVMVVCATGLVQHEEKQPKLATSSELVKQPVSIT